MSILTPLEVFVFLEHAGRVQLIVNKELMEGRLHYQCGCFQGSYQEKHPHVHFDEKLRHLGENLCTVRSSLQQEC